MKKTLIALAAVAASSVALAQNVTISGTMGVAFEKAGNASADLKNSDGGNGITLAGTEDLGGGLKAAFKINPRFSVVDGNSTATGGRWAQNANISLSGGFGTLTLGREHVGSAAGYDAFGAFGASYAWSGSVGSRVDNVILYIAPTIAGLSVRAAMTANNGNLGNEYTYFRATYNNGPLSMTVAQEKNLPAINAAGNNGLTDKEVGLSYDLGMAKLMVVSGKAGTTASKSTIGVTVPMGAITLKGAYQNAADNTFAMGADYALSKRTRAFADLAKTSGVTASYRVGVQHNF